MAVCEWDGDGLMPIFIGGPWVSVSRILYVYGEFIGSSLLYSRGIKALLLFEFPFIEDDMCEVPYSNF